MKQPISPLPWKIDPAEDLPLAIIQNNEDGFGIVEGEPGVEDAHQRQNFEYIVEACNNYPTAIKLLKDSLGLQQYYDTRIAKEIEKFLKSINNGTETH
jgi:hypothetical protein